MSVICPTVTATDLSDYRQQLEHVQSFAKRIHLDFMDGIFAPTRSIAIAQAWWQPGPIVDLHIMHKKPLEQLEQIISLQPSLVIIHAEAERVLDFLHEIDGLGIQKGIALLGATPPTVLEPILPILDHVLIFSGDLGHFGGTADLDLLHKVAWLKKQKPGLEIGWDGGINDKNVSILAAGGIDVLNVGGFIQKAKNPESAYDTLNAELEGES
jgi:pentose-5-phosphate-3-epimerase